MCAEAVAGNRPGSCGTCPLREITIYAGLDPQDGPDLTAIRREVRGLPAKAELFRAGQELDTVATLFDGWAFRYIVLPDGSRQILHVLLPGDTVGLSALIDEPARASVRALTDCIFCLLDRDRVRAAAGERPALRREIFRTALRRHGSSEQRMAELGRRTARQRVAAFLAELEGRLDRLGLGSADSFPFPLRHGHVADALGLTPIHVSRVFRDLQAQGVLRRPGRRIEVLDRAELHRLAARPADGGTPGRGPAGHDVRCQ